MPSVRKIVEQLSRSDDVPTATHHYILADIADAIHRVGIVCLMIVLELLAAGVIAWLVLIR